MIRRRNLARVGGVNIRQMRRNWLHGVVCVWTAAAVVAGGCHSQTSAIKRPSALAAKTPATASTRAQVPFTLDSDGKLTAKVGDAPIAQGKAAIEVLPAAATQALIARMEPLPNGANVTNGPAPPVRAPSAMPPRDGHGQPIAFVAPAGKQVADKPISKAPGLGVPLAPPQVLPIDEVKVESEIRVRFDEPMVPVAQVGQVAALPVTITPAVAGTWRWLDTRVATFTSKTARLPGSTNFTVTIPAGVRAVSGATLVSDVSAEFSTAPVTLVGTYPTVPLRTDSPFVVEFDQDVDATAIAKVLRVQTVKNQRLPWQLTTLDAARTRWTKNPAIRFDAKQLKPHYIVIEPKGSWPQGVALSVVLGKQAPSREGPRLSAHDSYEEVTIAPAFVADGISCDDKYQPKRTQVCSAKGSFEVGFSTEIDPSTYRAKYVQIEGEQFKDNQPSGRAIGFDTPGIVGRTYHVAIAGGFKDIYGQSYAGPSQLTLTTDRVRHDRYVSAPTGVYILDPRFQIPQWVVHAQAVPSIKVELFQVQPTDYFAYEQFENGKRASPPGKRVYQKTHEIGTHRGATARVDLRPALSASGTGHVIAMVTSPGDKAPSRQAAWVQVTRLGLTARFDGERVNAWTQDITPARFLRPIAGVKASLLVEGRTDEAAPVATDAQGHASFTLLPNTGRETARTNAILLGQTADDAVFTTINGGYEKSVRVESARWYVTDDRFTYKPGEKLYVKGWVRWTHNGINPGLAITRDPIKYTLTDSRGNKLANGTAEVTDQGGFDLEVAIPANANLGTANLELETAKKQSHRHPISIEEFRTPAYSVTLDDDVASHGALPLILGESIEMAVEARYYAGGGLAGSPIEWSARLREASYAPPGWDRYSFATVQPRSMHRWWRDQEVGDREATVTSATTLSGASSSSISFGIAELPVRSPSVLTVDATVTDVDRQHIRASSRSIVVHPASLYVGVRLQPDADDTLELVVTDIDGNAVGGVPIDVEIEGVLGSESGRDDAEVIDTQHCTATSARDPAHCKYKRKDLKTAYRAIARIKDARGRPNAASYYIPWTAYEDSELSVTPDRKQYKPGDVAKLEVRSTAVPAVVVVSFARQGVILQKRIEMTQPKASVELPIEKAYLQNVHVLVDRWAPRKYVSATSKQPLPEHKAAQVDLRVALESARLEMRTWPNRAIVEPGGTASFDVEVKHDGKPVAGAEVALMAVDEAVLAISGKSHADPLGNFYSTVGDGTWVATTVNEINDAGDDLLRSPGFERWELDDEHPGGTGSGYGVGSGAGGMRGRSASMKTSGVIQARKDFRATAVFSPKLVTDAHGKVRVTVKMPDSLTRFRIVALATAETYYFGKAENAITTQRSINARTVAPRFLTQGDAFALPVVVQNLAASPRTIDVAVRAANLTTLGPAGKRVTVPAGQRAEVRFDFATKARGRAVIQTAIVSGTFADASNVELPVYEPATTEAFATYGTLDDKPQFEQLAVPADVFVDVGGVETELASTQLQSLTDAFWYLQAYPFECAEQRSSRMLATAALYDILTAFAAPGRPSPQELASQSALDVARLASDQNADGGWGYFPGMKSDPYVTQQVLVALSRQKQQRLTTNQKARAYVTQQATKLLADLEKLAKAPKRHPVYEVSLAAATLAALDEVKVDVRARAVKLDTLARGMNVYPMDAKAHVLAMLAKQAAYKPLRGKLLAELLSAVHETAGKATVTAQYEEAERLLLVSNTKTTALALDAIMREAPEQALIAKLARGLLEGRKRGRWMSTQENLVALRTLRRYFDIFEKATPDYTGKLWLGNVAYAEQAFAGRTNTRAVAQLDWRALAPGSTHDIAIAKTGPGRMYYRIGITYAPKQTNLPALDNGFIVRRSYEAIDDPNDVTRLADGRWKIKLGARVLVRLETINTTRRHAVALVDPLPAGLEAVNTNLATSERAAAGTSSLGWDHTNMRDNRSEAFAMEMLEGSHRFSYTARASTPGTFIAAPAKAEEMYSPETFGRSSGTTVVIE